MSVFTGFFAALLAGLVPPAFAYMAPGASAKASSKTIVILDPGHGGEDLGAHVHGVVEKELCLQFAERLKTDLKRLGISVQLTRDADIDPPLNERVAESGQWPHAIYISLHANQAWHEPKPHGIIVYSYGKQIIAEKKPGLHLPHLAGPPADLQEESARLGDILALGFRRRGLKAQGVIRTDYYVLKNPTHPSVLVELGFLTNRDERRRLSTSSYQEKLSEIMSRRIEAYLRLTDPAMMTARR